MLRRAGVSVVLALLVGELALLGSPGSLVSYARILFYLLLGFSAISLLLGLFEEPATDAESVDPFLGRITDGESSEHRLRSTE